MCGITGLLHFGGASGRMEAVVRIADGMRRRGPDDEGYAFFDAEGEAVQTCGGPDTPEDGWASRFPYRPTRKLDAAREAPVARLGLGHRRLSILDLSSGGHQPMCTPDRRHWMVYNGEIYNFREIRDELEGKGIRFETRTDSEVLLAAWTTWGPACLDRLNGMFAFAVWDRRERRLFCARDRLGIKPFHYVLGDGRFLFASEIPALVESGAHPAELDPDGLYHGMSLQIAPRPMTAFRGVRALEPGHWLSVTADGRIDRGRYWGLPTGETHERRTAASYVEELDELLDRAVRRRLVADVPVGTFMSGGVDSTLISAIAAKHQPGIKALTLSVADQWGTDEVAEAKATADMWPMAHIVKETHEDYRLAYRAEATRALIEPVSSVSPNFVIAELATETDLVVVLSGSGGDEVFAGYQRFEALRRWHWMRRFGPLARLLPSRGQLGRIRSLALCRTISETYMQAFALFQTADKRRLVHPKLREQVAELETARLLDDYLAAAAGFSDDVQAMCFLEVSHYIGNHTLPRLDQILMHFSLEGRLPLLDHELVEFGMRLPSRLKIQGAERKWALRRAAERYVHASTLSMHKRGFSLPMEQWIRGPLSSMVREKLTALRTSELFDPDALTDIVEDRHRPRLAARQLWYLVGVQLWREVFLGADTPARA